MKRLGLILLAACHLASAGTPTDPLFEDSVLTTGLDQPTCISWAPDGSNRLFVSLKEAGIGVIENGQLRQTLFATFPSLYTVSECGVLGIAFDPDYTTNRYVYVFVTVSASEQRIVRFTDQNGSGTQRTNILTGLPTLGQNHDGGALAFGADGKLYFAIGDNGAKRGVDGNLTSLASKVGRCNKDGSVPTDNPFYDGNGPHNDYIWATGFRNPFTMTFHPTTGELWLNVVGSTPDGQTEPRTTVGYEQVFVLRAGDDGGYDDYEGNQPSTPRFTTPFVRPCVRPRIQYRTDYFSAGTQIRNVSSHSRDAGVLTLNTTSSHPYRVGEAVVLSQAGALDGIYVVQTAPSSTRITVAAEGATVSGTGGRLDAYSQGGCITGGCFYDSNAFPPSYAGNFFYGDLNSGLILRTELDPDGKPARITPFLSDAGDIRDIAVGPDGALYYCDGGSVHRVAYTGSPGFIVSPTSVSLTEGGKATFSVRLGLAPTAPVPVQVHKVDAISPGLNDVDLVTGANLTFTAENWDQPQQVTLAAPTDEDTADDTATFAVTSPGYDTVNVEAVARDANLPLLVTSTNAVEITEGRTAAFTVVLGAAPTKAVLVRVRPATGSRGRVTVTRGALLRFTPKNWQNPQRVVLRAGQDGNQSDETMTFIARATGYLEHEISVLVRDNDPTRPIFLDAPLATAVVNLAYQWKPEVRANPEATFALTQQPDGMTVDPATGALAWTPGTLGTFPVTLRATNRRGSTDLSYHLVVAADAPPAAYIIQPQPGATISGTHAEFFGGSTDDYGTWRAEFYIDAALRYTDDNRNAHYHLNGAHNLFDTTQLANGPHTLRMVVYDDAGHTAEQSVDVTVAN